MSVVPPRQCCPVCQGGVLLKNCLQVLTCGCYMYEVCLHGNDIHVPVCMDMKIASFLLMEHKWTLPNWLQVVPFGPLLHT